MPYVGKGVARKDALFKGCGKSTYVDDIKMDNMVFGITLRSSKAHAVIKSVDLSEAEKEKGWVGYVCAADVKGRNIVPLVLDDEPFFSDGTVRFVGEPIGLVLCEDRDSATRILKKIKVQYQELPFELDPEKALEKTVSIYKEDNVFSRHHVITGNCDEAFKDSDVIVERRYSTCYQEHAYLETQGMLAFPEDDCITVMGSMQCPFYVHDAVAQILGISKNRVRIVQTVTGGGFGGKEDVPSILAGQCALAADKFKRPVKLVYSREEDVATMSKRHPGIVYFKIGGKKDGTINAIRIRYILDGGAYSTLSPIVLWRGTVHAAGPYRCQNVTIEGMAVATNKVPCGAYRGFGQPQVTFAHECAVDELAAGLGFSADEFRKRNCYKLGDRTITGQVLDESVGLQEAIQKAEKAFYEFDIKEGEDRDYQYGTGLSTVFYGVGLGGAGKHLARAGAFVEVFSDGSVNVAIGNTEMGQGANTVIAQIAADYLGCSYDAVNMLKTDTTRVPDSGPTVASRTTLMSGNAVRDACAPLKERLLLVLAGILDADPEDLEIDSGFGYSLKSPDKKIPFQQIVSHACLQKIHLSRQGWFVSPMINWNPEMGQGHIYCTYSWAYNMVNVRVSRHTGEISILNMVTAIDVGKAINPQQVEGQIEGGALQGIGYGTIERILHNPDTGEMYSPNFTGYLIPTSMDIPLNFKPVIIESAYSKGPFGAKGFGEVPLIGAAPAIANAVFDATGSRHYSIPLTPEAILNCE